MKNASRVIAVHNHPSGMLAPSEEDIDLTDRLIQVGKILDIVVADHLIISTTTYTSFRGNGLMDELEKSLKYVPTYQVVEKIRKQEQLIAKQALAQERDKTKAARNETKDAKEKARLEREHRRIEKERREKLELAMVTTLLEKDVSIENIAKIMEITPTAVKKILSKNN